jgi:hypothetical protein
MEHRRHPLRFAGFSLITLLAVSHAAESQGRIKKLVEAAKAANQNTAELAVPLVTPTGVSSLDDVFADYAVLVTTPIKKLVVSDGSSLTTWYSLNIQQVVSRPPQDTSSEVHSIPQELLPVNPGTVLVPIDGGELLEDGVLVKQQSMFAMSPGDRYLLILNMEDGGRVGSLAADEASILKIDNGFHLSTAHNNHPLIQEIARRHNMDLKALSIDPRRRFAEP